MASKALEKKFASAIVGYGFGIALIKLFEDAKKNK